MPSAELASTLQFHAGVTAMPTVTADALTLLRAANDASPVATAIADLRLPDQPLVYVNPAFERITGYNRVLAIGRNCRFLQGPATDRRAIQTIHDAIVAGVAANVVLMNYRADGTTFRNRLMLYPVFDHHGRVFAYVSHQFPEDFFDPDMP